MVSPDDRQRASFQNVLFKQENVHKYESDYRHILSETFKEI
jgi:hypothetical protein